MHNKKNKSKLVPCLIYPTFFAFAYVSLALLTALLFDIKITQAELIRRTFSILIAAMGIKAIKEFTPPHTKKEIVKILKIAQKHVKAYYNKGTQYQRFIIIFYSLCFILLLVVLSWAILTGQL